MREEYNISELNPCKNPYTNRLKKQVTINIDNDTVEYFKAESKKSGLPYQTLINLYLSDCASKKTHPKALLAIITHKQLISRL